MSFEGRKGDSFCDLWPPGLRYVGRSDISRPLSVATSEWAWFGNDLVQRCDGEWGPSSPRHQTLPSPQLFEFKMSEKEVPITVAQRVVIKFLTNENIGPNEIWRRLRAQYVEWTLSKTQVKFWHKELVEEEVPCKTQVNDDTQGQASPQRISQWFVTLLKAIVSLLWWKFVRSLVHVSAMGACSPSSNTCCSFKKFWPNGYPGCWVINKKLLVFKFLKHCWYATKRKETHSFIA